MTTILYFFWDGFSQQSAPVIPDPPTLDSSFQISRTADIGFECH